MTCGKTALSYFCFERTRLARTCSPGQGPSLKTTLPSACATPSPFISSDSTSNIDSITLINVIGCKALVFYLFTVVLASCGTVFDTCHHGGHGVLTPHTYHMYDDAHVDVPWDHA